jgi:hypothetical protein
MPQHNRIHEEDFHRLELSVAMTPQIDNRLRAHFDKGPEQEDLTFALWRPSQGRHRFTAVLTNLILPNHGDRILQGNVAFTADYAQRVLAEAGHDFGIALLHSHLGPGWQGMSDDDIVAEQTRLAGAVAGSTGLPLVGLTWGTDGAWSARYWVRVAPGNYERRWASTVRVVGQFLRTTYHPELMPPPVPGENQVATVSVWGNKRQADIARTHVGIVGLGSVGSIVAEGLSRIGVMRFTLIDHDVIEERNLDRTLGAVAEDAQKATPKVEVARRLIESSHTASSVRIEPFEGSVLQVAGLQRALDCDVLFSCVDRPYPRHLLNALAYAHLIPVVDGGIFAKVHDEKLIHVDWRIHTVGPERPCMVCLGALRREDIALDMDGKLDDPAYIQGLGPEFSPLVARQNVFPFSLSVAAHEILQFVGLVTGQPRIGGTGPQTYHCYPGTMEVSEQAKCVEGCEYSGLTGTATDLSGNCRDRSSDTTL